VLRAQVDSAIKSAGYTFVAVDLEPFRSGRLNDQLAGGPQGGIVALGVAG
jgi:PP-loop superfamily ATP-utilizing enzyme